MLVYELAPLDWIKANSTEGHELDRKRLRNQSFIMFCSEKSLTTFCRTSR